MTFNNPITFGGPNGLADFAAAILNVVAVIATPIMVFFLIFAGYMYVTGRGNPEKIQLASKALTYAVIGVVVILGSVGILQIIKNVVNEF